MNKSIKELDNPEGHNRLIGGFAFQFSARAWEGHKNFGKGALVINMSEITEVKGNPGFFAVSPKYAPTGGDLLTALGFWPHQEMEQALKDYDPEKEVIFIVCSTDGMTHLYSWRPPEQISPPPAYEKWSKQHPMGGIGIHPNTSLLECLKLLIQYEFKQKAEWDKSCEQILSVPTRQAGFLDMLFKEREALLAEIEAGGLGLKDEGLVILNSISSPQKNGSEKLHYNAKIIEYMALTTALNQVISFIESNKHKPNWLKEAARIGMKAFDDKLTVVMVAQVSSELYSEGFLAQDEEKVRNIFLILAAARLRTRLNLNKYNRIRKALEAEAKAEGKPTEEVLLTRLLTATLLAWGEYEQLPHQPLVNDSKKLINLVSNIIAERVKPAKERKNLDEIPESLLAENSLEGFARVLEIRDEYAFRLRSSGLTASEYEVCQLKLQELTESEIAKKRGSSVGTVKALWSDARRKIKKSRKA